MKKGLLAGAPLPSSLFYLAAARSGLRLLRRRGRPGSRHRSTRAFTRPTTIRTRLLRSDAGMQTSVLAHYHHSASALLESHTTRPEQAEVIEGIIYVENHCAEETSTALLLH